KVRSARACCAGYARCSTLWGAGTRRIPRATPSFASSPRPRKPNQRSSASKSAPPSNATNPNPRLIRRGSRASNFRGTDHLWRSASVKRHESLRLFIAISALMVPQLLHASNHREAPITALDHKADITDLYAFVSYGPGGDCRKATIILCVDPFLEPSNGPTWFPFDPDILYEIKIDNDRDALADITFKVRFTTEYQLPGVYTALAGIGDNGAFDPHTGDLVVPPQIRDFNNPGLNLRQTYTVSVVREGQETELTNPDGSPFYAVPANAGPRTIDYRALFNAGTYRLDNGVSVFAGTVDDPFWIDLGAAFDTANFRHLSSGVPGVLTAQEDDPSVVTTQNLTSDSVSGFAVNAIAIEVPIEQLTRDGSLHEANSPDAVIGVW